MELIRSLYEAKRCCLKPAESVEAKAMADHKEIMQQEARSTPEALEWIERAVAVVVPPGTKYVPGACVPTFSACLTNTRRNGGCHGAVSLGEEIPFGFSGLVENVSARQEAECLRASWSEENRVAYQAIPEPCKVRVITKGPANLYTGLRRLQKFMVEAWKRMPFGTMVPYFEDRLKFRLEDESMIHDGDMFVSGDYSSATDAMHLDATMTAMTSVLRNLGLLGTELGEAALRSFSGALIEYPDGDVVRQVRGQLMGHPLSFPLLCIINLSTYMRMTGRTTLCDLMRSPLMVNGDDILFRGTAEMQNRWREVCAEVGLRVNEVKTYVHRKYYLINSVLGKEGSGKVDYYNRALAIGHGVKSEPVRLVSQCDTLWQELGHHRERVRKCGRRLLMQTVERLLPKKKCSFRPNWFVPKCLGGLGLSNDTGGKVKITRAQRKVATWLMRRPWTKILVERLGEAPVSVQLALKHLKKMLPAFEAVDRPGPLNLYDDYEYWVDQYLSRALRFTAWQKDVEPRSEEETRRWFINQALRAPAEKPARPSKILNYSSRRLRVVSSQVTHSIAPTKVRCTACSSE